MILDNWSTINSSIETIDIATPALAVFTVLPKEDQSDVLARITSMISSRYIKHIDAFHKFRITFDTAKLLVQAIELEASESLMKTALQTATDAMMVARHIPVVKALQKSMLVHAEIITTLANRTDNPKLKEEYLNQADREIREAMNLK